MHFYTTTPLFWLPQYDFGRGVFRLVLGGIRKIKMVRYCYKIPRYT